MKFYYILSLVVFLNLMNGNQINAQTDAKSAKDAMMNLLGEVEYLGASKLIHLANTDKDNQKDYNFQLLCGDIYLELENLDSAYYFYKAAEKLEDEKPEVLRKVGRVESMKGNYQVAVKVIEKAIEEDKKDVDSYLELADAHIRENKLSEAEIIIGRAKKLNDKEPRIYTTLGDMYFAQKVYELAKNNYEQALTLDSENMNAMLKLAESYQRLANQEPLGSELADELFKKCLIQYNEVTKRDPKNAKALLEQGKILFWSKDYANASNRLYTYAQLRPEGSLGRWFLAQSLVEVGKCDSASTHLLYASQNIDTVKIKAQLLLGQCFYSQKEYKNASNVYDNVYKDTTLEFTDYRRYATAKLFAGDTIGSVKLYKEALNKYPTNTNVCGMCDVVGKLMLSTQKFEEAFYFFNYRLSNNDCTDSTDAKINYFAGYAKINQFNFSNKSDTSLVMEAMKYFDLAIIGDSSNYAAYVSLGDCYTIAKKPVEAERVYNLAIDKASANPEANKQVLTQSFGKLCGTKLEAKNYKELLKVSTKWTTVLPESEYAWLYNGIGHQGNGDTANACKSYSQVLKINPENAGAKKNKSSLGC